MLEYTSGAAASTFDIINGVATSTGWGGTLLRGLPILLEWSLQLTIHERPLQHVHEERPLLHLIPLMEWPLGMVGEEPYQIKHDLSTKVI
jgi:hypothetical protein